MPEPSRTYHANQAMMLSDLIGIKFAEARFGTSTPRVIKVVEPDGPSTDGGIKARQSIIMVADGQDTTAGAIVCGWLDVARRTAELRSYVQISQQYQQRYGTPADLSKGEYERAIQELHEFLKAQGIDTRVAVGARRSVTPLPAAPPAPPPELQLIVVGGVAFVAGFLVCYILVVAGVLGGA
ncbi:MAG: hypothetical protein IT384_25205 [Deltaproteobacteria bacterium]|nr:hypothetical protein [Deltaproteobacteria bacterium]